MTKLEKKRKQKRVVVMATLATAAVIVGGMTFAWYQDKDSVTNRFETVAGGIQTSIVENFVPPTDWTPGTEVDKQVAVVNTGTAKAYVRAKFNEELSYEDYTYGADETTKEATLVTATKLPATGYVRADEHITVSPGDDWKDINDASKGLITALGDKVKSGITLTIPTGIKGYYRESTTATNNNAPSASAKKNWDIICYYEPTDAVSGNAYYTENGAKIVYEAFAQVTEEANKITGIDWYVYPSEKKSTVDGDISADILDKSVIIHFANDTTDSSAKWVYDKESGYYYYTGALASGATSNKLIDSVALDPTWTKPSTVYNLQVQIESVQALDGVDYAEMWKNADNSISANVVPEDADLLDNYIGGSNTANVKIAHKDYASKNDTDVEALKVKKSSTETVGSTERNVPNTAIAVADSGDVRGRELSDINTEVTTAAVGD